MDFSLSDEQMMLADSVAKFIDSDYDFDSRQQSAASDLGFNTRTWQTFAELGWTAVPFAEADGGLDGGPIELMLMMEQFGRGLVVEPYLANIVLAGGILRRVATDEQKRRWLDPLIAGETQATLAFAEPQARYDIANITTTATADGDRYRLQGKKSFVLHGGSADSLVIPARTSGEQGAEQGITLFLVASTSPGLSIRDYATVDGLQAAEITLDDVRVSKDDLLGKKDQGFAALNEVIEEATLAVCAEAMGIMQIMHDKTVEYTKSRIQFGVPISSFQALQHRMVDCLMSCEQTRSLLYRCVMLIDTGDVKAKRAVSALKYKVGTAGIHLAEESVQLHGGMGVTWELDIAHYFKRMTAINIIFGNADFHLDRYIELDDGTQDAD